MAVSFAAGIGGAAVNAYWGQTGGYFLRDICDTGVKYATVSFINNSPENGNGYPGSNFGANCAAEVYNNNGKPTKLLSSCTFIQRDIPYCQDKGVKVLLAVGGAPVAGTNYTVSSEAKGVEFAEFLYNAFGPYKSSWTGPRPFDQGPNQHVSVDGFDLDLEVKDKNWSNKPYIAMVNWWRQQSTKLFITAAPECVITTKGGNTNQNDDLIANAQFDALFIQFYNNKVCDAIAGNDLGDKFSYDTWVSNIQSGKSKDAKIFIGLPASLDSAGSGYITPKAMKDLVCQYSTHKNFGGVSLWDGTRGLINKDILTGKTYVQSAVEAVNYICQEPPKTTTTKSTSTSTSTKMTSTTSSTTVKTTTTSTTTTSTSSAKPTTTSTTSTKPTSTSTTSSKATTTTSSTTVKTTTTSSTTSTKPTSTTTSSTKSSTSTTSSKPATTSTTSSKPATTTTTSSKPVTTTSTTSSKPATTTTTSSKPATTTTTTSSKPVTTTTSEKPATTTTTTSSKPVTTTTSSEKPDTTTTKTSATESTTTSGAGVTSTSSTVTPTTSKPVSLTTSTVYTTSVHTVTKCPPTVTNCPVGHVTTETIPLYTTVCPVTETAHPPKPTTTKAPVLTTSTVYTTKTYTITKCPPAVTNCPVGHVTTEVVPAYTTVCPVEETETGNVPQPTGPAPLTTNTETRTLTRTVKVQGSSSLQTLVRPTEVPQPSAEGCSGPGCPGVTSTPGSGCTGPECPGVAIPTNSWTSSPVGPSATPSTPVTAGASTLALGLTGLVAIVAAQLFAM